MGKYKAVINPFSGKMQLMVDEGLVYFKAGVATAADLPTLGNTTNDARITSDDQHLHIWDGSAWQDSGDLMDITWDSVIGRPESAVDDIDDAVAMRHVQNSDTKLDESGAHEVSAEDIEDAISKEHVQGSDTVLDSGGDNEISASAICVHINAKQQMAITLSLTTDESELEVGFKGFFRAPYSGTIVGYTLIADASCSAIVDVWKATYANYPPTNANSICNGHEPALTTANKGEVTDVSNWSSVAITKGDIIAFNLDSVSGCTFLSLSLHIEQTHP